MKKTKLSPEYNQLWYKKLNKAPWTPPNYVFGIIWPILYVLMFISLFLVFLSSKKCSPFSFFDCKAVTLFGIQFFFNIIWTRIFFGLQMPKIALLDLCLVLFFSSWTVFEFYKINIVSALLLIPYISWLLVAFSLNTYSVLYN